MSPLSQRVFVGIKATPEITTQCLKLQKPLLPISPRLIPPEDIHLTLLPPWQMQDLDLTVKYLQKAVENFPSFALQLENLEYGPTIAKPRLVWICCTPSKSIINLKQQLLDTFQIKDPVPFIPHLTIARFSESKGQELQLPRLYNPVNLEMNVDSIKLYASPHEGGTGYKILASIPLI